MLDKTLMDVRKQINLARCILNHRKQHVVMERDLQIGTPRDMWQSFCIAFIFLVVCTDDRLVTIKCLWRCSHPCDFRPHPHVCH